MPPELPYEENQVLELALQAIQSQITVTCVQAKLSLHLTTDEKKAEPRHFTIVGL